MANDVSIRVLTKGAKEARAQLDEVKGSAEGIAAKAGAVGKGLTTGLTLPLVAAGGAALKLAGDQEEAEAKMQSSFDSMQAGAWTTTDALKAQASQLQENSTFGDELVLSMQGVLLTFGNVKNEVGEGNQIFDRASQSIVDMSAKLGTDLQSSATMVGKALNDPVKGLAAMSRVGIQFTKDQEEMIKSMVESGDTLGAQKIILGELEKQFGGTAAAVAQTSKGQMKQAMNSLGDAAESVGAIIAPIASQVAGFFKTLAERFQSLSPETQEIIVRIAALAAAIGPLLIVGSKVVGMFKTVGVAFKALSTLMMANPWALLIAATIALVVLIVQNWDKIVAAVRAAWDWIKNAAAAVGQWISDRFNDAVEFVKMLFLNFTPLGLIIKNFDKIKELATGVKDWIVEKFDQVVDFFSGLPERISRAVTGLWDGLKNAFRSALNWIIDKWNNFSFGIGPVTLPSWLGGGTFEMRIDTPNIPRLHSGGVFRAPRAGGEGLALLQDQETVLTPAQAAAGGGGSTNVFVLNWDDFVRHVRKAQIEGGRLGFA